MSSWARPGVKCVCVHTGAWKLVEERDHHGPYGIDSHPSENEVCTIEYVRRRRSGVLAFGIEGYHGNEYGARWFRPLVTQEDDVAMFTHLLKPHDVDARVLDTTPSD